MRKVPIVLLILAIPYLALAQVSVQQQGSGLDIYYRHALRLQGAAAWVAGRKEGVVQYDTARNVLLLQLSGTGTLAPDQSAGVCFKNIPGYSRGLALWRYGPWNSWTKPMFVGEPAALEDSQVQFFYWQYSDGLYGAAVPLSGKGYRTTIGKMAEGWGSKAVRYGPGGQTEDIPGIAVAFGTDPFELFARIYQAALKSMGRADDQVAAKHLPEPLQYIGWCTWNASDNGKNLDGPHILDAVKTFADHRFQLGWVLIDDGWFQQTGSRLRSLHPDPQKFPEGFKPLIRELKSRYGIRYMGIWHALDGYWNGIDTASELGTRFKGKLFSWKQKKEVASADSATQTCFFIRPDSNYLYDFYSSLHGYLRGEGFDFIKVDNQLVTERMAAGNYPIDSLASAMHRALFRSAGNYFNGAMINCMDMTPDAYFNFGPSAVARAVEDYFPYQNTETYNLQKGNAAAHVLQAIYNALYFSQMVYPDFDMFQSHNPNAVFHALARTLNNGPVYITDIPGKQNFDILSKITFADGKSIRSQDALLPAEDCLFQVQGHRVFKAFSKTKTAGLLVLYNAADTDVVAGGFKAGDVHGLKGNRFAIYEHFSGRLRLAARDQSFAVRLPRMGYQLHYVVPVAGGIAPFGLVDKYNAPAAITGIRRTKRGTFLTLYQGGCFKAYAQKRPSAIWVNGRRHGFLYQRHLLTLQIPGTVKNPLIRIK